MTTEPELVEDLLDITRTNQFVAAYASKMGIEASVHLSDESNVILASLMIETITDLTTRLANITDPKTKYITRDMLICDHMIKLIKAHQEDRIIEKITKLDQVTKPQLEAINFDLKGYHSGRKRSYKKYKLREEKSNQKKSTKTKSKSSV